MADFYSGWVTPPNGGTAYRTRLRVTVTSQSVEDNTSTLSWEWRIYKQSAQNGYYGFSATRLVQIDGSTRHSASGNMPDAPWTGTSSWLLASGTYTVEHDTDGTKSNMPLVANYVRSGSGWAPGSMNISATMDLPTIPRATTPTVTPASGNTGVTYTITHEAASEDFYHDVAYSLDGGDTFTNIATNLPGTDTSTDWTPAHSLFPSTTSGTATIRLITRDSSGGAIIGTKTVALPLTVPSSVRPAVSGVSWEDAQTSSPDIPTLMGGVDRFVQRWSRLKPTVTSAGAGGSTVTSTQVTMGGQSTSSGVAFTNPVALSGSVPFSATATDTRGRVSAAYSSTVPVKAYNFPSLPTPLVVRTSDAGGTAPDPTGTYLAITPAASVSSLDFGDGEKNLLEWRIRTRPVGGSWTTVEDWNTAGVSGNTWTTKKVIAGYASNTEYEVEVSIRDVFGKNGYNTSQTVVVLSVPVPSEEVFMVFDKDEGIGIGGYRRFGKLDVHGDIYQNGEKVLDETYSPPAVPDATTSVKGIVELATNAETQAGTDSTRAVTPAGLSARSATTGRTGIAELATQAEVNAGTDNTRIVTPSTLRNRDYAPYAMAAGTTPANGANISNGTGVTMTITFPVGRFTQVPILNVTVVGSARLTSAILPGATTSSATVRMDNFSGGTAGSSALAWQAVQMTSGSGAG